MGAEPHAGKPAGRQEAEPGKLRAGSIGVPSAMVMSIAIMAPAAGMIFLPQVVASHAGAAVPLVYLMSLIACLFIAGTITQFARLVPHAGSFYAYDAVGLGRTTGFVSGWLLMAGYFVFYPQNLLAAAYFTSSTLREELGWNVNWSVWAVLFAIAIWLLSTRGIRTSMRTDLTVVGAESLIILIVVIGILVAGGAHGNTAAVFTPSATDGKGWNGIFLGMVFAMLTFVGFEGAATLGEETGDARRNVPRAIWAAVIGCGLFFLLTSYALAVGYGPHGGAAFATASGTPMYDLAVKYVGSGLGVAVNIAGIVSAFAVCLACNNASTRVLFAMGRDDVLPGGLGRTHKVFRTPARAINLVGFAALALSLLVGLAVGPYPSGYADVGQFGTIPILILYILACLSLIVYMRRLRAAGKVRYNLFKHLIAPVIGIVIVFLPIYGSVWPWPPRQKASRERGRPRRPQRAGHDRGQHGQQRTLGHDSPAGRRTGRQPERLRCRRRRRDEDRGGGRLRHRDPANRAALHPRPARARRHRGPDRPGADRAVHTRPAPDVGGWAVGTGAARSPQRRRALHPEPAVAALPGRGPAVAAARRDPGPDRRRRQLRGTRRGLAGHRQGIRAPGVPDHRHRNWRRDHH